jgi:CTP synthase
VKYVFTTGGLSGLGKGVLTSSIGKLLQAAGYKVHISKIDPYLNVDAGTMNPFQHGEVFVLDDGTETDQDLGNYERFLEVNLRGSNVITTGKVYMNVLQRERRGDYLGATVQIVPHITDEIQREIKEGSKGADIIVVELGGTVGHMEIQPFLEAVRLLAMKEKKEDVMFVHLSYIPVLEVVGEQKTMPTQENAMLLRQAGIQPDVIVGRCRERLKQATKRKIKERCNVDAVFSSPDLETVYELPLFLEEEGFADYLSKRLDLEKKKRDLRHWKKLVERIKKPRREVTIAITGKYTELKDSYISLNEALVHAGAHLGIKVLEKWVETTDIEEGRRDVAEALEGVDGIIVPGGFGGRGVEGKIMCAEYARKNSLPYLGLCYGLQIAVVEFARDVCGLKGADTTEHNPETKHPVVFILPEKKKLKDMGGTLRLGAYPAMLTKGTRVHELYGNKDKVWERHRHRYEVNPEYIKTLEKHGLVFSGRSPDRILMEFMELPEHPYFVATQAHPEFKSRLESPAPLFYGLVRAALERKSHAGRKKEGA